eukprot:250885-Hanusia_phi.AAC.3
MEEEEEEFFFLSLSSMGSTSHGLMSVDSQMAMASENFLITSKLLTFLKVRSCNDETEKTRGGEERRGDGRRGEARRNARDNDGYQDLKDKNQEEDK